MKTPKEKLSEVITTKPDVLQFAKDRKYEESWIINLSEPKPSDEQVNKFIEREKFETIIVEYIWNSIDDDNRFVLTLFLDKNCKLQNPKQFININLELFYNYSDFHVFQETINRSIIGSEYLLMNSVDSINLSVFNYWLSVGPVELWKKGKQYNFEEISSKIKLRPEIEKTALNYQGLLFRFNIDGKQNGPYYGIKTPCCNKIGDEWVIDYKKIDYWMRLMLEL